MNKNRNKVLVLCQDPVLTAAPLRPRIADSTIQQSQLLFVRERHGTSAGIGKNLQTPPTEFNAKNKLKLPPYRIVPTRKNG